MSDNGVAIDAEAWPSGDKPYAKGRNGFFDIKLVYVTEFPTHGKDGREQKEILACFHSRAMKYPGSCYAAMTPKMAMEVGRALISEAAKAMAPENTPASIRETLINSIQKG